MNVCCIKTELKKHLKKHISLLLTAVIHTLLSSAIHVIHVDQGEHGEGTDEGAGLDGDAAPQQAGMPRLV